MKILALDTATEACSVALNLNGEIVEHFELLPRRHSRELLGMIDNLLKKQNVSLSDLDALAFGCGPGAFTGLRVATAMVQGLAFAIDKPVVQVSTLRALAQEGLRVHQSNAVLAAIDARMGEVYWGAFKAKDGLMQPVINERVIAPERVIVPEGEENWLGMGTGWQFEDQLAAKTINCFPDAYPRAADIAILAAADFNEGHAVPAERTRPVYLRDKVALKKSER
ncbi:tRNA (adenosine(37)-N6)-threonylcarbamoyltransferase complex dimerization subunit type 1 TsaB [Endozoicomonas numazuensis]|uniref:tRNA threonylcarbamoyladenosine biosynthesis protein TsaB n=1 Tax=Endozoicomonas numazuensis TaxID=1137799 RepID=A0A081NM50_9GAMM|nr:tRNA (adenosine(37)-N6)-threonylcarbamoyltransferase complex dimerization subunit type 1 TsaB [Endozoicomonas numazuensis]KEQ19523.1 peptidase M22 [Endozoicomonas numazuensis]